MVDQKYHQNVDRATFEKSRNHFQTENSSLKSPSKMKHIIRKWSLLTANEGKSDQKSRTYSDEKVSRHFNSDDYNSILGE